MKSRLTPARVLIFSLVAGTVQFGLAMILLGGWRAFFSHPALIALTIATLGMMLVAPFSKRKPELRRKRGPRQPLGLHRLKPDRIGQRHRAALYRSHRPVDHRRRNNSLDRRDVYTCSAEHCDCGQFLYWVRGSADWWPFSRNTRWKHTAFTVLFATPATWE